MKTSSFKEYTGDKGVAICLYPPIDWDGMRFPSLEPERRAFFAIKEHAIDEKEYERLYRKNVLARLDPQYIYDQLKDNVLLCWEKPNTFCHRRIVAEWLHETLGVTVDEWNPADEKLELLKEKNNINPLF